MAAGSAAAGRDGFVGPVPPVAEAAGDAVEVEAAAAAPAGETGVAAAAADDPERRPLGGASQPAVTQPGSAAVAEGVSDLGPTMTTLAAVVALIVVVFGIIHLARRGRGGSLGTHRAPSGILEVLGRYPMAGGPTLVLLRADRRILLLSQARASRLSGATLSTLAEFEDVDDVASILAQARDARDESISARFGSMLHAFAAEHADGDPRRVEHAEAPAAERVEVRVVEPDGRGEEVSDSAGRASAMLRRRLEGLRAWEGATA